MYTVVSLKNRYPHKYVKEETPEEIWNGQKLQLRQNGTQTVKAAFLLAIVQTQRLFDPKNPTKITKSRDVVFLTFFD